jgi:hypothetical protein
MDYELCANYEMFLVFVVDTIYLTYQCFLPIIAVIHLNFIFISVKRIT